MERHRAVNYALVRLGAEHAPVAELSDEIGISSRRLVDVFSQQVGLTPKLFARVQRFQNVIQNLPPTGCGLDGRGARLRLLRPGTFHTRLPKLLRPEPQHLSEIQDAPHESRAHFRLVQIFTIPPW